MNKEEIANKMEKLAKGFRFGAITIYEKEELIKKLDNDFEQFKKEFLAKLEEEDKEEKPFEVELPEEGTILYYFNGDCKIDFLYFYDDIQYVVERYKKGFCFETKEETEQHLKEQRLIFKIKKWAKIHNDGWVPDWSECSQYKYSVDYNRLTGSIWATDSTVYNSFSKIPYFKTEEIAQACINEFGEEIREVFY